MLVGECGEFAVSASEPLLILVCRNRNRTPRMSSAESTTPSRAAPNRVIQSFLSKVTLVFRHLKTWGFARCRGPNLPFADSLEARHRQPVGGDAPPPPPRFLPMPCGHESRAHRHFHSQRRPGNEGERKGENTVRTGWRPGPTAMLAATTISGWTRAVAFPPDS